MDANTPPDPADCRSQHASDLLAQINAGDAAAAEMLLPIVYEQLRAVAGGFFRAQAGHQTLQPTALVHEAYIKIIGGKNQDWESRAHFCAVASMAMRQILHDRARMRRTAKRGGGAQRVPLDHIETPSGRDLINLVALDDALTRLADIDPQQARIVELRFFGGLTVAEVARVLDIPLRTTEREWQHVRLWLRREIDSDDKG